ncbi:MAG: hypothetical protein U0325_34780 [Polyangiales bacterium]
MRVAAERPRHCGACGRSCALAHVSLDAARCDMGRCVIASACEPGWGDCNGVESDGCETALVDATNCGACGNRCSGPTPMCRAAGAAGDGGVGDAGLDAAADGSVSAGYACASGCMSTERRCGTTCVDVTATRCTAAPAGTLRQRRQRRARVPHGRVRGAVRRRLGRLRPRPRQRLRGAARDRPRAHCGACDTACADVEGAPGVCVGGRCALTCGATVGNCDGDLSNGCEANLLTDVRHCGACGAACPTRASSTAVCRARASARSRAPRGVPTATRSRATSAGRHAQTRCAAAAARRRARRGAARRRPARRGACGVACRAGYGDCDAIVERVKVDTRVDVLHCGGCGRPCAVPANGRATCAAGSRAFTDEGRRGGHALLAEPPQQLAPRGRRCFSPGAGRRSAAGARRRTRLCGSCAATASARRSSRTSTSRGWAASRRRRRR